MKSRMCLFDLERPLRPSQDRNNRCTKFALPRRLGRRNEAFVAELMDKWENEDEELKHKLGRISNLILSWCCWLDGMVDVGTLFESEEMLVLMNIGMSWKEYTGFLYEFDSAGSMMFHKQQRGPRVRLPKPPSLST
ncbi:hypothetical protein C5167_020795 [Papaver somniferum]|uniref:Uncharacterized protein n=1 Tax=Papaver somniferum TaxID=3469 RepID=A0A4Y7IW40_PAPSO|nr:hypothetical protein C5167_020795 [Papaver somniferum]